MRRISSNIHMQCFVTNGAMYRLVLLQSLNLDLKKFGSMSRRITPSTASDANTTVQKVQNGAVKCSHGIPLLVELSYILSTPCCTNCEQRMLEQRCINVTIMTCDYCSQPWEQRKCPP